LEKETRKSVSEAKGEIYKKTNVSSTGLEKKMRIEVGILDYATREVLFMEYEDGR